jgi:hypothetical protein
MLVATLQSASGVQYRYGLTDKTLGDVEESWRYGLAWIKTGIQGRVPFLAASPGSGVIAGDETPKRVSHR